ncbi:MAG TPA: putative toxin-antitoxin system toxin component, PIN family [Dehalococcoidia bacterium]|nr:putative toxin-antitoxin system toxin component, PIN family [Dehalococcoidia bacterium]
MVPVLYAKAWGETGQRYVPAEEPVPLTVRIALDTNLLVSALIRPAGSAARILRWWRDGKLAVVASESTLREAELVLGAGWLANLSPAEAVEALLHDLRENAILVRTEHPPELTLRDRGDRDLVAAAAAGGARYLVTADQEVLLQRGYGDVEFITSGEFVERMTRDWE